MKKIVILIVELSFPVFIFSQNNSQSLSKTRLALGASLPELLHIGLSRDLGTSTQLGFSIGSFPNFDEPEVTLNAEHRFYFGKPSEFTLRKTWFTRQGFTYRANDPEYSSITLSFGKEFGKKAASSTSVELGLSYYYGNIDNTMNRIVPAIRIQRFFYFKKKNK